MKILYARIHSNKFKVDVTILNNTEYDDNIKFK